MSRTYHHGMKHNKRAVRNRPWHEQMVEPGWWIRDMMTVPRRAKTTLLEREVTRGGDPEGILWPLDRKPHLYFW